MSIHLTEAAVQRVTKFLATDPSAVALRFGVKKTGCSGYSYTVDLAKQIAENDQVFEQDGVKVVVDALSLPLVDGTEIDYARQGINSAFVFRNPNVAGACGCGESFTV
jgi:iron-sulfur cluster assembly protein